MMIRNLGKLIFSTVQDNQGKIQIILQKQETQAPSFDLFKKYYLENNFFLQIFFRIIQPS